MLESPLTYLRELCELVMQDEGVLVVDFYQVHLLSIISLVLKCFCLRIPIIEDPKDLLFMGFIFMVFIILELKTEDI